MYLESMDFMYSNFEIYCFISLELNLCEFAGRGDTCTVNDILCVVVL